MFEHEYDLSSLIEVKPQGETFSMLVTPRYRGHYEDAVYEAFSSRLIGAVAGRAGLFLDLGAHYGFYSLMAATRHTGLEVIAVEPVPETHFVLSENVSRLGLDKVQVHRAAVSDSNGTATFNRAMVSDNCGFFPHPNAPVQERIEVPTRTVDSFLADRAPCPLVIKIDTEGHELAVLEGMRKTLATWPDVSILLEFNPKMERIAGHDPMDVVGQLDQLGFVCFLLDDRAFTSARMTPATDWTALIRPEAYANLYCVRRERALSACFFAHNSYLNGASRSLKELVCELIADHGTLATVVVPGPGPLGPALKAAGASVLEVPLDLWCTFPPHPDAIDPARLLPSLSTLVESVLPVLRRIQPDVVFSQTLAAPWGAVTAALLAKPHVWSVCEYGEADHDLRFDRPFAEVREDIIEGSNLILVNSERLGHTLFPGLGPERIQVIRRHIHLPDSGDATTDLYRIPGALRIGCFSTLQEAKGQMDAVEALAELRARGVNAELLLAGWAVPAHREALEQAIREKGLEDRVHLPGFLDDPYPAMRASDIVLQCSRQEAFGRAAVEAMLLGKPLVYTLAGGFQEYLEDGRTGLGYPPGDIPALVRAITCLIADPERAAALGRAAREEAGQRFSREAFGGACFKALTNLRVGAEPPIRIPRMLQPLLAELGISLFQRLHQQQEIQREAEASLKECTAALSTAQEGIGLVKVCLGDKEELSHLSDRLQNLNHDLELARSREKQAQAAYEGQSQRLSAAQAELRAITASASWRYTRHFRRWKKSLDKRVELLTALFHRKKRRKPSDPLVRDIEMIRASGQFDGAWYLEKNPDVAAAGVDPIWHFVHAGAREGRAPNPSFNTLEYTQAHPEIAERRLNPFIHWLESSTEAVQATRPVDVDQSLPERAILAPMPKILAWYLPQFHPIPENDAAWGKGFTEWRNVTRARPLFPGHQQPQLPADLGFYDLRVPEVRQQQAELARHYGIHGFVYHYYWFNGRKTLEVPLEAMLGSGEPDFPFCISWANENWTRRWDGLDSDIILKQEHSLASDLQFLRDILPILKDRRYITCEGRPMLIVYRPDLLHDPAETAAVWRDEALRAGLPGLHLCAVRFRVQDPIPLGFDALVEFPPHQFPAPELDPGKLGAASEFRGRIWDFAEGVRLSVPPARKDFPYYRGVMPGWDNTPRRMQDATIFHGATPELFEYWLHRVLLEARHTAHSQDHFVFINAWNEWAEGTHLEPDLAHGHAWLEAARRAIDAAARDGRALPVLPAAFAAPVVVPADLAVPPPSAAPIKTAKGAKVPWRMPRSGSWGSRRPVLCVSHDAARAGAQLLLLRFVERLARHEHLEPWVLLRSGGALEADFRTLAPVLRADEVAQASGLSFPKALRRIVGEFRQRDPLFALCNTVVSSDVAQVCDELGIPVLSHVHELPTSIDGALGRETIDRVARHSRRILLVSAFVRDALVKAYGLPIDKISVLHNGIHDIPALAGGRDAVRPAVLKAFGLEPDAFLVLGCGSIHPRKGTDLFVQLAARTARMPGGGRLRFLWIGQDQAGPQFRGWCEHDLAAAGLDGRVRFAGEHAEVGRFFAAADALALTSREDPFPTINLEAMAAGIPVLAFEGAGGAVEVLTDGAGLCIPYLDVEAMARALVRLAETPAEAAAMGARARERFLADHLYEPYFTRFMELVERDFGPIRAARP